MAEIYVDVLLVINYVVNTLLLSCLARCAGRKPKGVRLAAAAALGAIGSLTIFLPAPGFWMSTAEKLLLSALMVRAVFHWRGWRGFLREWLIFFAVSFFFAGAMLAVWLMARPPGMLYYNGVVYFDIPALLLVALSALAYLLLSLFWRLGREGRILQDGYAVKIRLGGRSVTVHAMVDTGNSLYEPFSGSPVIVCHLDDVAPLLGAELCEAIALRDFSRVHEQRPRLRFVRYRTVEGDGMLPAFRADRVELASDSHRFQVEDVYIAVSAGKVGAGGYGAILNPDLAGQKV